MSPFIILLAVFVFLALLPWLLRYSRLDLPTYLDRYNAVQIFLSGVVLVIIFLQPQHSFAEAIIALPMGATLISTLIAVGRRMRRTSLISKNV